MIAQAIAGASKIQKFSDYLTSSTDVQKLERMSEFWTTVTMSSNPLTWLHSQIEEKREGNRFGEVQEAIAGNHQALLESLH